MLGRTSACLRNLVQSFRVPSSSYKVGAYYTSQAAAASSLQTEYKQPWTRSHAEDEYADVDWDNLGFGLMPADYMYTMKGSKDGVFEQGQLRRYGTIDLSPSAGVRDCMKAQKHTGQEMEDFFSFVRIKMPFG